MNFNSFIYNEHEKRIQQITPNIHRKLNLLYNTLKDLQNKYVFNIKNILYVKYLLIDKILYCIDNNIIDTYSFEFQIPIIFNVDLVHVFLVVNVNINIFNDNLLSTYKFIPMDNDDPIPDYRRHELNDIINHLELKMNEYDKTIIDDLNDLDFIWGELWIRQQKN